MGASAGLVKKAYYFPLFLFGMEIEIEAHKTV